MPAAGKPVAYKHMSDTWPRTVPDLVRAWVPGYALSRGLPPAVEEPWGARLDVGLPHHRARHVLPDADEITVRKAAAHIEAAGEPCVWLKTCLPDETAAGWLGAQWTSNSPGFLMSTAVQPREATAAVPVPAGYALVSGSQHGVTEVRLVTPDGTVAATGQMALGRGAATAVIDQIETDPDHRRRGLGSVVVRTLIGAAAGAGATDAVLCASVEGRGLYEALGWRTRAPFTSFIHRAM